MIEKAHAEIAQVEQRKQLVREIGLGELRPAEVVSLRNILRNQIQIGLQRDGSSTQQDGGLLAIRTGIPSLTPEAWNEVPVGSKAFVADIAGTNWNVMHATKGDDGSVTLTETSHKPYYGDSREVTFDDFIGRMAYPIAGEVISTGNQEEPTDIGISLGFPHENKKSKNGIDAHLLAEEGELPKGWKITDWDPDKHSNITLALRKKLQELGVNVRTLVAINDTPAVSLDGEAVATATKEGLEVLPAGFVGGTGTNGAVDKDGLVNLEIGRATWPTDQVFEKMKENGWIDVVEPELETETGMYLPLRLAAGMQLLCEKEESFTYDEAVLQQLISNDPSKDQALVSKIALGDIPVSTDIQNLAKAVMKRAGQVYGAALAAIAESAGDQVEGVSKTKAFLVEGGSLLKGHEVKATAEATAVALGQPLKIVGARGLRGVATLAMAYPHLEN